MSETTVVTWNKKKFSIFIVGAFGIGWILQIIGSILARQGNQVGFTLF